MIQLDLDGLWEVSRVKEELCTRIEAVRRQIQAAVDAPDAKGPLAMDDVAAAVPEEKRGPIRRLTTEVGLLKREVEAYRKGNVAFIEDSLKFIDDLIGTITGGPPKRNVYDRRCRMRSSASRLLLTREV